ncbi:thialysine N-epsilon-acetyltransferase-like isoform X2 [Phycodurus eques]|uniref:thialysine N-epsilon-acetyltransferase-like isoform X2 n=1 Tax=Phycodurus eques TaxID=693459 RepID=UPI002ACE4D79|nr:thialysine N-epsilon-acetyltransferase-like isoform X2 [Phycodurus eques]
MWVLRTAREGGNDYLILEGLQLANMNFTVRAATKEDCKDISRLIKDSALRDKTSDPVKMACEGFTIVGYALYFDTYSTWKGRSVYLEDFYVMPEFRGFGIGKSLLSTVGKVAKEKQCAQLLSSVLDGNTPSRDFYAARGAQDLTVNEGWHVIRFDGPDLERLAKESH